MPFEMSIGWVEDGAPPIGVLDLVFKTYKGTWFVPHPQL